VNLKHWKRLPKSELEPMFDRSELIGPWAYSPVPGYAMIVTRYRFEGRKYYCTFGHLPGLPGKLLNLDGGSLTSGIRDGLRGWWSDHLKTLSGHEIAALAEAGVGEDQL
jgi:hypothetical protein